MGNKQPRFRSSVLTLPEAPDKFVAECTAWDGARVKWKRRRFDKQADMRAWIETMRALWAELHGLSEDTTLAKFSERWLERKKKKWKSPNSLVCYTGHLNNYILPRFGNVMLRSIQPAQIVDFLVSLLPDNCEGGDGSESSETNRRKAHADGKLAKTTVSGIRHTLHSILEMARGLDKILAENPAKFVGDGVLNLSPTRAEQDAKVQAMALDQLQRFLAVQPSLRIPEAHVRLFHFLAETGVRPGEGEALQWECLDYVRREAYICRHIVRKRTVLPGTKTGPNRMVDLTPELVEELKRWQTRCKEIALATGRPMSKWVFADDEGAFLNRRLTHTTFKRVLEKAGVAAHFSLKSMRHTYATQQLMDGAPPKYIQHQLGHSCLTITMRVYARWLRDGDKRQAASYGRRLRSRPQPEQEDVPMMDDRAQR